MKYHLFLLVLLLGYPVAAQVETPRISPKAEVRQLIGLTEVRVDYSRPAARGRKIFGDLVPYGRIWRVGANESTKISLSTDAVIRGNPLPAGTYALYAFPGPEKWEVVFHSNLTHWGDGREAYDPGEDVFRIPVVPEKRAAYTENFTIGFDRVTHNGAVMQWSWANTLVEIPITVDTDGIMRKKIARAVAEDPSARTFYEAARYFQEQGIEQETSKAYLLKAIELEGDTYFFYRILSLVEAELGNYEGAIRAAEKSLNIAQRENKDEFVRMNKKNIRLWREKLQE